MKKYYFMLIGYTDDNRISGHANTLVGIRHIFKKVTNARVCMVYKKCRISYYDSTPFITYQK